MHLCLRRRRPWLGDHAAGGKGRHHPEQLIANVQAEHSADFADFLVNFDNFHSTHSPENRELAELIYTRLRDAGHIATRSVTQYFDPEKGMFLADRFIKGTCPAARPKISTATIAKNAAPPTSPPS